MTENPNTPLPVDEETLLRVLSWLHASGIEFVLDQSPNDCYSLDPHEVVEYLADSEAFLAEAMGVSMEDYQDWQAAEGAIQCHAKTKSGRRCRNMIAEANDYLTPRAWVALRAQQPTCRVHGGREVLKRIPAALPYPGDFFFDVVLRCRFGCADAGATDVWASSCAAW